MTAPPPALSLSYPIHIDLTQRSLDVESWELKSESLVPA